MLGNIPFLIGLEFIFVGREELRSSWLPARCGNVGRYTVSYVWPCMACVIHVGRWSRYRVGFVLQDTTGMLSGIQRNLDFREWMV
jgi:hypothetical protein